MRAAKTPAANLALRRRQELGNFVYDVYTMAEPRTTTVRLTPETRDRLRDVSRAEGMNPDSLVRELLDRHERGVDLAAREQRERISVSYRMTRGAIGDYGGSGAASVRDDRAR
jgi:predicted DNA-binding protein